MDGCDKRLIIYFIGIFALIVAFIVGVVWCFILQTKPAENGSYTLSECFYYQPRIPYIPKFQVLGTAVDETLFRIIKCESNFQPEVCNADYGCSSGIGLGQLTAGAIKDCEKGLEKTIDPYNGQDNLECSTWLYEKYGTAPWGCPDCWWGSYDCWKGLTE